MDAHFLRTEQLSVNRAKRHQDRRKTGKRVHFVIPPEILPDSIPSISPDRQDSADPPKLSGARRQKGSAGEPPCGFLSILAQEKTELQIEWANKSMKSKPRESETWVVFFNQKLALD
jgi:hypothetical protein